MTPIERARKLCEALNDASDDANLSLILAAFAEIAADERERVQGLLRQANAELMNMTLANGLPERSEHARRRRRDILKGVEMATDALSRAIGEG